MTCDLLERDPEPDLTDALLRLLEVAGIRRRLHERGKGRRLLAESRCVVSGMDAFLALKTLNTSAIASMRALRHSGNERLMRRFN